MISETDLLWWCALHKAFALTDIRAVCDLGQQEFFCSEPAVYERVTKRFAALCGVPEADISKCRTSADFWRMLGREIVSLDVAGSGLDFHYFDLNRETIPAKLRNRFDFVTNIGTTEHVLNQFNALKTMHDLTRPSGVMAHAIPAAGFSNHGFFRYNMKLFWHLAKANEYECFDAWMSIDKGNDQLSGDVVDFLRGEHGSFRNIRAAEDHPVKLFGDLTPYYRSTESCLYVFLRKKGGAAFRPALDLADGMDDLPGPGDRPRFRLAPQGLLRSASTSRRRVVNALIRRLSRWS